MKSCSIQSKFHVGQKIRVVAGVTDPDYGFPIGGWSGCVEDIVLDDGNDGSWLYEIQWDRITLKSMERSLHKKCEKDGLDVTRMVLAESELEAE